MSPNKSENMARRKKLNRLVTISAIFGAIPGFAGAAISGEGLLTPLESTFWGVGGGILGGSMMALLVILKVGLDKYRPAWWFIVLGFTGGMIGSVTLVKLMEWIELFGRLMSRYE